MSSRSHTKPVFSDAILPDGPSRLGAFGAGFGLECLALAAILILPIFMPRKMVLAAKQWVTPVTAPFIEPWKPEPPAKPEIKKVLVKQLPKPVEEKPVEVPKPKIYNPVVAAVVAPKPVQPKKMVLPDVELAKNSLPTPILGSSAIPTLKKPRELVQTGGFGDPNSVPDNHNATRAPNMMQAGGFDMPAGPGSGNGTGGAKGAKGVVASAGFGDQVAAANTGAGGSRTLQASGFGDTTAGGPGVKKTSAASERSKPVEFLFVPKPSYTAEARAKKIEGDVVLQVLFAASGEVRILRVVQGLGYGLDEAAESAARQIRFTPAEQDGQPVDFTANVRMKCELAY